MQRTVAFDWINLLLDSFVFALLLNSSLQEPSAETYEGKTLSYQLIQTICFAIANCCLLLIDDVTADVVQLLRFSLLQIKQLISRFLPISNADVIFAAHSSCTTDSRLLLFIFFFDISSSRLHRFRSRSHFCMRPVLFPPKRSNEQDSLRSELLRFWPNSFV
ncbi:hypothetical protein F511_24449 [Dorcoceras hygrometricum]|uniref:Uncharacterized protein n=1 Tax=Dorcoceras hygrometricum TaxID=472368 RepID=A0A2Z7CNI7_9LAMI|nr:hypothetical protein F511_24449 [Dorcoceras hygrometricum]